MPLYGTGMLSVRVTALPLSPFPIHTTRHVCSRKVACLFSVKQSNCSEAVVNFFKYAAPSYQLKYNQTLLTGFTTTVFAYGSTGSGKTHTIAGTEDEPGILPRAVHMLFQRLQSDAAAGSDKAFMVFLT